MRGCVPLCNLPISNLPGATPAAVFSVAKVDVFYYYKNFFKYFKYFIENNANKKGRGLPRPLHKNEKPTLNFLAGRPHRRGVTWTPRPDSSMLRCARRRSFLCCGGRTRTCDLKVMSLPNCQLFHPAILGMPVPAQTPTLLKVLILNRRGLIVSLARDFGCGCAGIEPCLCRATHRRRASICRSFAEDGAKVVQHFKYCNYFYKYFFNIHKHT